MLVEYSRNIQIYMHNILNLHFIIYIVYYLEVKHLFFIKYFELKILFDYLFSADEPTTPLKKKGFFKSFWKKSKHYSLEQ